METIIKDMKEVDGGIELYLEKTIAVIYGFPQTEKYELFIPGGKLKKITDSGIKKSTNDNINHYTNHYTNYKTHYTHLFD